MTRSTRIVLYAVTSLFACLLLAGAWFLLVATSHDRVKIKLALRLPLTRTELLRQQVIDRVGKDAEPRFANEILAKEGELCGQVSIRGSNGEHGKYERFISSLNQFTDIGGLGLVAQEGSSEWKRLEATLKLLMLTTNANLKNEEANKRFLHLRWNRTCPDQVPFAEMVADRREAMKASLKDPDSAIFRNDRINGQSYCGEINAKNSLGGYTGFTRFYFVSGFFWQIEGSDIVLLSRAPEYVSLFRQFSEKAKTSTQAAIDAFRKDIFNKGWSEQCNQ